MIDKVNKLFETIRPLRLAQDLNLSIVEHDDGFYFIKDPLANKKLWYLKDSEFVSPDRFHDEKALNIVSFLVKYNNISFEDAVDSIFNKYQAELNSPVLNELKWARVLISDYLEDIHNINKLIQRGKKNLSTDNKYTRCRQILSKSCADVNYVFPIVSGVSGEEINEVIDSLKYLKNLDKNQFRKRETTNFFKDSRFLVIPTYASYGVPTFLRLVNEHTQACIDLNITEHSCGFFGLHSMPPTSNNTYVTDDSSSVMKQLKSFHNHGAPVSQSCVSIEHKDGLYFPNPLPRGIMVIDENTNINNILQTQESFRELAVIHKNQLFKSKFDQSFEARTYVINKFLDLDNAEKAKHVESIKNEPVTHSRLTQLLKRQRRLETLALIDSNLVETENFVINGSTIISTPDGYVAENGVRSLQFTNFTLSIKEAHVFRDSSDIYYTGQMSMSKKTYPFIISKVSTAHVRGIISACIYSVTSDSEFEDNEINTPALLDSTFGSTLRNLLNQATSRVPVKLGVNRLGWDTSFSRFQAPTWSCNGGEIESKYYFKHPNFKVFRNFDWSNLRSLTRARTYSNLGANTLIALTTSAIIRYYFNSRCKTIRIKNSKNNTQLLTAVLNVFGQLRAEEINPNLRKTTTLQGIDGYPMVCYCSNLKVLDKISFPSFTLTEDGHDFGVTDVDYVALRDFCNLYFPNLINYIIRTNGKHIETLPGDSLHDQIQEGLQVMKKIFPNFDWQVTITKKHGVFGDWLNKVRYDFETHVKMDFKNQKIRFVFNRSEEDTLSEVKKYLESLNIEVRRPWRRHITGPYSELYKVLEEVFINIPKMGTYEEKISTPEEPRDTSESGLG